MMKKTAKVLNKKGVTLLEIMISMMVASILYLCVISLIFPNLKNITAVIRMTETMMIAGNIEDYLKNEISYATQFLPDDSAAPTAADDLSVINFNKSKGYVALFSLNDSNNDGYGELYKNGFPVFDTAYYRGREANIVYAPDATIPGMYNVTITIRDSSNQQYSKTFNVVPMVF